SFALTFATRASVALTNGASAAAESGNREMTGEYVLLLLTVVVGAIASGMAIGCNTIRDWSWMVVVGVLIFLGAAALPAVANPRVPGNLPSLPADSEAARYSASRRCERAAPCLNARWCAFVSVGSGPPAPCSLPT